MKREMMEGPIHLREWTALQAAAMSILLIASAAYADWPQFRGPDRDGKSSETGLLKEWPRGGPTLLWAVEDLGIGFASVVASGKMLYTTGVEGETGYVYAYDLDGDPLWRRPYGSGWSGDRKVRPGARTTPTFNNGLLYVMSAHGRVACLDAETGEPRWFVDTKEKWGAHELRWGIAESLLIDGDNVICTPGGDGADIVALNKETGETVWICDEIGEKSAYCSPILVRRGDKRLIVTLTAKSLVGVEAEKGQLVWRYAHKGEYGIHAVSPVYEDGRIYITSGYGGLRGQMLELSPDGNHITSKWRDRELDCHHGGIIMHEGHVYGTSDRNNRANWICLDVYTGDVKVQIRGIGKGSVAYADGMFFGYGEDGQVGLITASPSNFRLVSSFEVTKGTGQHWAHPTIAAGRLYIRHGNAMLAYDIKAGGLTR